MILLLLYIFLVQIGEMCKYRRCLSSHLFSEGSFVRMITVAASAHTLDTTSPLVHLAAQCYIVILLLSYFLTSPLL